VKDPMPDRSRLSLNQMTINQWSLAQAIEGCARHGLGYIGVWRDKLAERPIAQTVRQLSDAGLKVSGLCRGGFFSAPTAGARAEQIEDNRRAIEECAAIGSPVLVLIGGPANGQTLVEARVTIADAIAELAPFAKSHGVQIGIEPLHPMYNADRCAIVTMQQATDIALPLPAESVGVIADVFQIWWDPRVQEEIARAGKRLVGFHVSDWLVPLPDFLFGRGMMGKGIIDIRSLRHAVDRAGYTGPIEVEIFNKALWKEDPDSVMQRMIEAYLLHV
jgi:sugar phosphate isomerase/epimerase